MKRRRAIAQASPYALGIVGVADSYALHDGKLLYVVEDKLSRSLRILDLRGYTNQEVVVDVPTLVFHAVPESEGCRKYIFRILHHAAGITSCLYSFARPRAQHWLLIFDARRHQLIGKIPLESTIRLFVRNDSDYLIYGTHSVYDANGTRKWVLRHFNLRTRHLLRRKMPLADLVGYEIGSAVCFEIFDQHFYGCANQRSFELEEIDWTSHYYCFRFPLDDFDLGKSQTMAKRDAYRRQHTEGPIDDRWAFLNLERDEVTGTVRIVECRREWLNGGSENMRTYYMKEVRFPDHNMSTDGTGLVNGNDPLPNVPLAGLLTSSDHPNYTTTQIRQPHEYHHGDSGRDMTSRNRVFLSSYKPICASFTDLVDDPADESGVRRLRLRSGLKSDHMGATQHDSSGLPLVRQGITSSGQDNLISVWPPSPLPEDSKAYADILEKLDQVMNPPGFRGSITASGDDRSIVYSTSTGEAGSMKVLFFLTFDPAVKLAGMIRVGCVHAEITNECRDRAGTFNNTVETESKLAAVQHASRWPCCKAADTGGSGTRSSSLSPWSEKQNLRCSAIPPPEVGLPWASIDAAMHQKFSGKYDFSFRYESNPAGY